MSLLVWDGAAPLVVGSVVSWSNVKSIVRWLDDAYTIIENSENGCTCKVSQAELSVYTDAAAVAVSKLSAILENAPANAEELAQYLVTNGVIVPTA
ncbi:hypothetical protein PWKp7_00025 [Klebsiella phage PWKp7]|nr:hypothetical protein PWKp1_00052 [Klebsiella phage PWKp1]UJD04641.1 hypothetical protein PWKp2_00002 [Klebsiella phage PWKp2]UJD04694.1 hypothetical protein PWKp3_00002 [Klebsiella phage PWKp3]UJD04971.1 hypothetical protein PWKp7_00025 [Klebsiella phage PWKp7]UJD05001.1 hypothetical protein PWKp9B_00001 [Klebsiella phage PWKp9B]